ncbi:hypothetical protein F5Y08DRAFT_300634 [Xylaria arbuscula]|nr:hypothetical protein F5Y08DRAFT_300634 [Xylaria arbuscula]
MRPVLIFSLAVTYLTLLILAAVQRVTGPCIVVHCIHLFLNLQQNKKRTKKGALPAVSPCKISFFISAEFASRVFSAPHLRSRPSIDSLLDNHCILCAQPTIVLFFSISFLFLLFYWLLDVEKLLGSDGSAPDLYSFLLFMTDLSPLLLLLLAAVISWPLSAFLLFDRCFPALLCPTLPSSSANLTISGAPRAQKRKDFQTSSTASCSTSWSRFLFARH